MADFDAIDALLAVARQEAPLPPAQERRSLREDLNLSRAQLAQALGVSTSTVGGWESGREPGGEVREKYAYFLEGARAKLAAATDPAVDAELGDDKQADAEQSDGVDDVLAVAQPCVLCGQPAQYQVEGFPQHLDPADCGTTAPVATPPEKPAPRTTPRQPAPDRKPGRAASGVKVVPVGRRVQAAADTPDLIGSAVAAALAEHAGDVEAATAALIKRAIPDAMALLDHTRKGGRYDVVAHPWLPDILRKQTARGADQVWEARPKWSRPELPAGEHEITALDINGAYLSALKTHLPLGQLEHSSGNHHDRRRAGLHLITPPAWDHEAVLPNPVGNRDEPGAMWVTEPTLRLLLRVSGPKYGLCDPPEIHESWTSGATEGLLEKFRIALKDARDRAIAEGDEVTLEYVKAMYSKFVSTLGESNYNRELYRTDWMHLIRSQAFANLWWKAHRAYDEGLMVVRAMGTDELHVAGDWRAVFPEGRGVTEVKVKDTYTVGTDPSTANEPPESAS
ncbi:helix-turn-helix domain-containing protein [Streptomyces phaeochromogenes]|uniref:helix-turn-helix domain-containing protein n=1 Tax=Streptomyces phaeochromogenes TaxID=1923 RepID=UPI002E0F32CE|nr:helix-turn-helix domain-containing protein [Streptomyces phaeochromogenes]WSJ11343.1 helix-turn-helix domain-containing protein [Streptomyces phaeochromogenes]